MNLGMVYTCNMKISGKYERREERECTLHHCPKSWESCDCTRPFQELQRHLVDSGVQHQKSRGNYCSKLKKES